MSTGRLRRRTDRFELRGWTYWVSLSDHGKLAALVADTDETQHVKLLTELTVEVRPGDVPVIFEQLGWPIPGKRRAVEAAPVAEVPSEPASIEPPAEPAPDPRDEELAALRAENEALKSRPPEVVERIVEVPSPAPPPEEASGLGEGGEGEAMPQPSARMVSDALRARMRDGETIAEAAKRLLPEVGPRANLLTNRRLQLGARFSDDEVKELNELNALLAELTLAGDAK